LIRRSTPPPPTHSTPSSFSKRYDTGLSAATKTKRQPVVIDLGDSSDDDGDRSNVPNLTTRARPAPTAPDDDDAPTDDPDELFPELAAEAREKARQRERDAEIAKASLGDAPDPFSPAITVHDPVLSVFINTKIPNTEPLLVSRKYSQNLKAIRLAWCGKQGFTQDFTNKVFFTYRGLRVFDVASCKSLGIELDYCGRPIFSSSKDPELADKLVLTATTQAIVDEEKRAADAEKQREKDEAEGIYSEPDKPIVKEIRIFLKAKGHEPYRLRVKDVGYPIGIAIFLSNTNSLVQETTFEKIAGAFRKAQKIPDHEEISLKFDGDVLEPEDKMTDTDIEDMDSIEVHIK
jgi:hypothetical protein